MTFEVEINGVTAAVTLDSLGAAGPEGGRFRVTVREVRSSATEAAVCDIDATRTDLGWSFLFTDDHRSLDVATTERAGGETLVQLPHVALTAVVDRRRIQRSDPGEAVGHGEQRVVAPMPGRVVRVLVKVGDSVTARQGLVVVEAMKMENELTVPRAGRVKDVSVSEGASVEAGRLLVIVE